MKLILCNSALLFGRFQTKKYVYQAGVGTYNNVFLTAMSNKKSIYRLTSVDGGVAELTLIGGGVSSGYKVNINTAIPIFFTHDPSQYGGTGMSSILTVSIGGTFTLEVVENSFELPSSYIVNQYGQGCYLDTNYNVITYNSASWAATSLVSNPVKTDKTLLLVDEALNKNITIHKWDYNWDYIGSETINQYENELYCSQFTDATYIRVEGTTSVFSELKMFDGIQ